MKIIQLVKRFGPVGGMEEYVWQLTKALSRCGMTVTVVCEESIQKSVEGVNVVTLGVGHKKPRWRSHINFARKVKHWEDGEGSSDMVFHSHELIPNSDIFTFHSTPHGQGGDDDWWRRLDPTWHINQWLESRVVSSKSLRFLVPVSDLLLQQLSARYPNSAPKCIVAIPPGVEEAPVIASPKIPTLGFLGREWQRKGLRRLVDVFRELQSRMPEARLVLGGMPSDSVSNLVSGLECNVDFLGFVRDKEDFYRRINLLVHPAYLEAFGMVVTEAMARGIPVLVSDQTGAASEVGDIRGQVLSLNSSNKDWADAAQRLCSWTFPSTEIYRRSWDQVAADYVQVYQQALTEK
ncbi:MAG: glycosyltransferase family 4 protein [Verrucomicrobiota bacterium]|nr:glycosyltransferase family 4 protein [Verrucomicrobiota bacterium]